MEATEAAVEEAVNVFTASTFLLGLVVMSSCSLVVYVVSWHSRGLGIGARVSFYYFSKILYFFPNVTFTNVLIEIEQVPCNKTVLTHSPRV